MTQDPKKPNSGSPQVPGVDLLPEPTDLSEDPFSEDYEATVIEASPHHDEDADSGEETTEVTQRMATEETATAKPYTPPKPLAPAPQPLLHTPPKKKSFLSSIALITVVTVGIIALVSGLYIFIPYFSPHPTPKHSEKLDVKIDLPESMFPPQDHDIQVSQLTLLQPTLPPSQSLLEVVRGQEMRWEAELTHWQTRPNQPLQFHMAVKIFAPSGLLVYDAPEFKTFSQPATVDQDQIKIDLRIAAKPESELGVYRIRVDIVDDSSRRTKTLQTRFRILSQRR